MLLVAFGRDVSSFYLLPVTCYLLLEKREFDPESGLNYHGARFMDSKIGRFLQVDKQFYKYVNLTQYQYCANNPLIYVDPNGEEIYIIVHGDGASNTENNNGHQGRQFELSAETKKNEIIASDDFNADQDTVIIGYASNRDEFTSIIRTAEKASAKFGDVKQMDIYSHAYSEGLNLGGGPVGDNFKRIKKGYLSGLKTSLNFADDSVIRLYGCLAGFKAEDVSETIAQSFANKFGTTVKANILSSEFRHTNATTYYLEPNIPKILQKYMKKEDAIKTFTPQSPK